MAEENEQAPIAKRLIDAEVVDEMRDSYMLYAMSVIISRALPDARDGLKPAQRRILYAMSELNLSPGAQHRKCAKITGDTAGNYHPHGDTVIYPTLVRMAQDFALRYPLVDGQGNFGSIDGDPPAAQRYTEARMSPYAMELLEDLDKETVDFQPNYDNTTEEPVVLPGKFPNLICNGGAGIAVGMATNLPPHNLSEVCDGLCALIENPDIDIDGLMEHIKGPDFPLGGFILGRRGIKQIYETGRGSVTMQARAVIEPMTGGKNAILVTELPYEVNKSTLIQNIAALHREKKIDGITDIRDESDRKGMRIVIELRRDVNPNVVLNQLYKRTELRKNFNAILLSLVDGAPKVLDLKSLLEEYKRHRIEVVTRRTRYLLNKARERAHILEGFRIALDNIDEVIKLIRASRTVSDARSGLMERFGLSTKQSDAILQMPLSRLTGLEREKIEKEYNELLVEIARLEGILADRLKVLNIIKEELEDLKKRLGDERRTRIIAAEAKDLRIEDLIAAEDMVITLTRDGYIKRLPIDTYRVQHRGGKGLLALSKKEEDETAELFIANTHHHILCFTNTGKVYRLKAHEVPSQSRQSRGTPIVNLVPLEPGEQITATVPMATLDQDGYLVLATRKGQVKKTELREFDTPIKARGIIAQTVPEGDELCWVKYTDGAKDIILVSNNGQAMRFDEAEVRPMGRNATGVIGIRMRHNDELVSMVVVDKEDPRDLLVAGSKGLAKRTPLAEYPTKGRGGMGVITMKVDAKTGPIVAAQVVEPDQELLVITKDGIAIRVKVKTIRQTGRNAMGVKLISLAPSDELVAVTRIAEAEHAEPAEGGTPLDVDDDEDKAPALFDSSDEDETESDDEGNWEDDDEDSLQTSMGAGDDEE